MYAFLAYWVESVNYAYLTGDIKPLSQVTDATATIPSVVLDLYQKNTGWVIGPQHIFTIELSTPGSHDVTLKSPRPYMAKCYQYFLRGSSIRLHQ